MDDWIRTKDRLPELIGIGRSSENCLVYESGDFHVACYVKIPNTDRSYWSEQSSGCGCCSTGIDPTHWMPLPKPPEWVNENET